MNYRQKESFEMKKKIIFLDIDGVLNGYNFWNVLGWDIVCFLHISQRWYRKLTDPCGVHENKVKRLEKIVKKTGAKVVMSSSWRAAYWKFVNGEAEFSDRIQKLAALLNKYNIEVIDITPRSSDGRRDNEILSWLSKHEDEIESFVILDDERFDLECFANDRLVQTSSVSKGKMIKGHWSENTGLKRKHVKQAIQILKNEV